LNERQIRRWEKLRRKGRGHYVWVRYALTYGGGTAFVMSAIFLYAQPEDIWFPFIIFFIMLFGCSLNGVFRWYRFEWRYLEAVGANESGNRARSTGHETAEPGPSPDQAASGRPPDDLEGDAASKAADARSGRRGLAIALVCVYSLMFLVLFAVRHSARLRYRGQIAREIARADRMIARMEGRSQAAALSGILKIEKRLLSLQGCVTREDSTRIRQRIDRLYELYNSARTPGRPSGKAPGTEEEPPDPADGSGRGDAE
jgi:hypothetical protein